MKQEYAFKRRHVVSRPRSALSSNARLPPCEAGEFADSTARAVALAKESEMGCIGMGSLRKKLSKSVFFCARLSSGHARLCLLFRRALFVSRPSKVPFIENKISLIEFARKKVA